VLWTAITDAFDSNAMYIFNPKESAALYKKLPSYKHKGMQQLFDDNRQGANFIKAPAGTCILFSSTLFHGNQVNQTNKTRISLNCRFKALFSPEYATVPHERVTGMFYEPLFLSPVTKIGLDYDDAIAF
jgi:sporadic carbohydrate cluster 2OG-Fe(II) oxygenase